MSERFMWFLRDSSDEDVFERSGDPPHAFASIPALASAADIWRGLPASVAREATCARSPNNCTSVTPPIRSSTPSHDPCPRRSLHDDAWKRVA